MSSRKSQFARTRGARYTQTWAQTGVNLCDSGTEGSSSLSPRLPLKLLVYVSDPRLPDTEPELPLTADREGPATVATAGRKAAEEQRQRRKPQTRSTDRDSGVVGSPNTNHCPIVKRGRGGRGDRERVRGAPSEPHNERTSMADCSPISRISRTSTRNRLAGRRERGAGEGII